MASSTFKGRYEECDECTYQFYDKDKNRNNCIYSHNQIRNKANNSGIKYERNFIYCGLKLKRIEN